jgi:hypothetical protein
MPAPTTGGRTGEWTACCCPLARPPAACVIVFARPTRTVWASTLTPGPPSALMQTSQLLWPRWLEHVRPPPPSPRTARAARATWPAAHAALPPPRSHKGSCGLAYQWPDIYPGFDVAAIADASGEFSGSCGCVSLPCGALRPAACPRPYPRPPCLSSPLSPLPQALLRGQVPARHVHRRLLGADLARRRLPRPLPIRGRPRR